MKLIQRMQKACAAVSDGRSPYATFIEACAAAGEEAVAEALEGRGALGDVNAELVIAREKFGKPFASAHEGIAILREEFMELEREVFWGSPIAARDEAVQVAAMALRFIEDVCDR